MEFNKRMAKLYEANYFTPQLPMRKYSNPYYLPSSQTLLSQILATGGMSSSGSAVSSSVGPSLPPSAPKPAFDATPKMNPEDVNPDKPKPRPVVRDPARQAKRVISNKIKQLQKSRDPKKDDKVAKLKKDLAKTGKIRPIIKDKSKVVPVKRPKGPKPVKKPAPTKGPTKKPTPTPTKGPKPKPTTPPKKEEEAKKTVSGAQPPFLKAELEGQLKRDDIAVNKGKGRGGFDIYRGLNPKQSKEYGEAIQTRAAKFRSFNEFKKMATKQAGVAMSRAERKKFEEGGSKTMENLMREFEKANATIDRLNGLNTSDDPFGRKQGTKVKMTDASSGQGSLTASQIKARKANLASLSIANDKVRETGRAESQAEALKKGTKNRTAIVDKAQKAHQKAIADQKALQDIEQSFSDASKKKKAMRGGN